MSCTTITQKGTVCKNKITTESENHCNHHLNMIRHAKFISELKKESIDKETMEEPSQKSKKKSKKVKEEEPQESKLINLTKESSLFCAYNILPCSKEEFQEFWNLCPTERHQIFVHGKHIPIPRFQKLYGNGSYKYSGSEVVGDPNIPLIVDRALTIARGMYPKFEWNGALVNWYPDGSSYIGAHSDDEKDLVPGAPILSFSLGGIRTFRIKKKTEATSGEIQKMDFKTYPNSLIVMQGKMQSEYKHEVPKTKKFVEPRINITVRNFNNV